MMSLNGWNVAINKTECPTYVYIILDQDTLDRHTPFVANFGEDGINFEGYCFALNDNTLYGARTNDMA